MNNKTYHWKTASVISETADALTIEFETNGQDFIYKPGQFVNLRLVIGEEAVSRSYSLSSAPDENEKPAITIKKVDGGIMSNHVFNHASAIKQWEVDGPYGSFYADPQLLNDKPIVLIGGGSGITPLYSILKSFLKHTNTKIWLINCNRTWKDVIFANSLTQAEQAYAGRLQVVHFLSRETATTTLPCKNFKPEKLSRLVLKKTLKKLLAEQIAEAEYFLCGPNGLNNLSEEVLDSLQIPSAQIHTEHFIPPDAEKTVADLPQSVKEVLLHYYEQTNLLEVQPGKSILETALEDRIPLSYSCKNGTCGKCAAKQTAGKLHMGSNYALTDDHIKQGYVLLCQSHPLDDEVTIIIE
jgi:ferredoxin-NADP reductase